MIILAKGIYWLAMAALALKLALNIFVPFAAKFFPRLLFAHGNINYSIHTEFEILAWLVATGATTLIPDKSTARVAGFGFVAIVLSYAPAILWTLFIRRQKTKCPLE